MVDRRHAPLRVHRDEGVRGDADLERSLDHQEARDDERVGGVAHRMVRLLGQGHGQIRFHARRVHQGGQPARPKGQDEVLLPRQRQRSRRCLLQRRRSRRNPQCEHVVDFRIQLGRTPRGRARIPGLHVRREHVPRRGVEQHLRIPSPARQVYLQGQRRMDELRRTGDVAEREAPQRRVQDVR